MDNKTREGDCFMPAEYNFEFVKNEIIPSFPNLKLWEEKGTKKGV